MTCARDCGRSATGCQLHVTLAAAPGAASMVAPWFLAFDGPLVVSGHATYLTDSAAAARGLAASGQQG